MNSKQNAARHSRCSVWSLRQVYVTFFENTEQGVGFVDKVTSEKLCTIISVSLRINVFGGSVIMLYLVYVLLTLCLYVCVSFVLIFKFMFIFPA